MTGIRHSELKLLFRKEYIRFFLFIHIPFYIWLFFTREYPDFLATMDATIVLFAVMYSLLMRPMILNGTIRAYYRRHYRTKTTGSFLSVTYTAIWFSAMLRSTLLIFNFCMQYFTFEDIDIPKLVAGMKMNYLDVHGAIIGAVVFFLYLYVIYYKDRFISVHEFSDRTMRYVLEHGFNVEVAMVKVLNERQMELKKGKLRLNSDVTKQKSNPMPATSDMKPTVSNIKQETQSPPASNVIPMRRYARK